MKGQCVANSSQLGAPALARVIEVDDGGVFIGIGISPNSNTKPPREYKTPLVFRGLETKGSSGLKIIMESTREYKTPLFSGLWRSRDSLW